MNKISIKEETKSATIREKNQEATNSLSPMIFYHNSNFIVSSSTDVLQNQFKT